MSIRKTVSNILIVLAVVFTGYLSVIMIRRISTVVLKDDYRKIFRYELIACAFFLPVAIRTIFFAIIIPATPIVSAYSGILESVKYRLFAAIVLSESLMRKVCSVKASAGSLKPICPFVPIPSN